MKVLFVDRSVCFDSPADLSGPRGGRVNSLHTVTQWLSNHMDVDIFHGGNYFEIGNVKWRSLPEQRYDVIVFNRGIGGGLPEIEAKHRVLWTHDLPHSGFIPDPKMARALSCVVMMSRYGDWIWRKFYRHIGKSVIIPNGVDKTLFKPAEKAHRRLIYASAPNRGLDRLGFIFEALKARVPDVSMVAYSNLKALHPGEHAPKDELEAFSTCEEAGIERKDPIPQADLAQELAQSTALVLPTEYPEICSNIVLQALACGTPVLATGGIGATPEWVKSGRNGLLTETMPHDYMAYQVEFVRNAVKMLEAPERYFRGALRTRITSWNAISSRWLTLLSKLR